MRAVVLIGAADGGRRSYQEVAARGLASVAVDRNPRAPAVRLADRFLRVSTRDVTAVVDAVRRLDEDHEVCGVLSPSTDAGLAAQQAVARVLGLPCGLSDDTVRASHDKAWFRRLGDRLGLPGPAWVSGPADADLVVRALRLPGPWVVKPSDAQSSRGLTRGVSADRLPDAVAHAGVSGYGGEVMVETELGGRHLTAECVVVEGRVAFQALSDRAVLEPPLAVTTEHALHAELDAEVGEPVRSLLDQVCRALGYAFGSLTVDLVVDGTGTPYLVEMGARTGGDPLGELSLLSYGVDTVAAAVALALGEAPDLVGAQRRIATVGRILHDEGAGVLTEVRGAAESAAVTGVRRVDLSVGPGDAVRPMTTLADKRGAVLATGADLTAARCAAKTAARAITFGTEETR